MKYFSKPSIDSVKIYTKKTTVPLAKIKIPHGWVYPKAGKLLRHLEALLTSGEFDRVYIDENYCLVDGYCDYLLAKAFHCDSIKCVMLHTISR